MHLQLHFDSEEEAWHSLVAADDRGPSYTASFWVSLVASSPPPPHSLPPHSPPTHPIPRRMGRPPPPEQTGRERVKRYWDVEKELKHTVTTEIHIYVYVVKYTHVHT